MTRVGGPGVLAAAPAGSWGDREHVLGQTVPAVPWVLTQEQNLRRDGRVPQG